MGRCGMLNRKKATGIIIAVSAALIIAIVAVCDFVAKQKVTETVDYAMGAIITQKIEGKNGEEIANEIIEKIKETETDISWRIESGEIALLNENKKATVSQSTKTYLLDIIDVCEKSNGAVDLTVGRLTNEWNIGSDDFHIPEDEVLDEILSGVDYEKISFDSDTVSIGENQLVDLGFVGKGIACDEAKKILEKHGVQRGIISVGGSLCLHGEGTFSVGIRNPLGSVNDYMATLTVEESFVSTSGNYERFSEKDEKKYHHILSTETGYPVENNLLSVTIVCDSGLLSDALSTACYCLGYEESLALLKEYNAEAVFIFDDNTVRVTSGLEGNLEINNNEFKLWKEN
ncbi:MAG: FAD:protein FMN transferase [Ruminococcaceae bacterium]|nr:FAD:protein FMN transferase [Oscillospiraceae bacterium]